jgi:hypothetical protein
MTAKEMGRVTAKCRAFSSGRENIQRAKRPAWPYNRLMLSRLGGILQRQRGFFLPDQTRGDKHP